MRYLYLFVLLGAWVTLYGANMAIARRRATKYFHGVGMRAISMKIRWLPSRIGPLSSSDNKLIFCAHLKDPAGVSIPAWIASAGIVWFRYGNDLEVRFSRTGAFRNHPEL